MTFQALQNSADLPPAGDCGAPADGEGNYTYGYGYLNVLAAGQQYCSWKPWITPAPTGTPTRTSTPTITRTPTCTPTTVPPDRFTNILPYTLNNLITYFVGPWEREPNNTYETANGPLMLNQAYYGYPNDSEDRFYFILEEPGTLTINLTNYTASGAQLLLYGADPYLGHLVVDNTAPFQIVYAASAGQYYLRIYAVKDFNTTQPYTLSIAVPALRLAQATPPASGVTLTPPAP